MIPTGPEDWQMGRTTSTGRSQEPGDKDKFCRSRWSRQGQSCYSGSQETETLLETFYNNPVGAVLWQNDMI